jgi:hypothetical protein
VFELLYFMGKSLPIVGELLRDDLELPIVLVLEVLKFACPMVVDVGGGRKVVYSRETWVQGGGYGLANHPTRLSVCYQACPPNELLRARRDLGDGRVRIHTVQEYSGIFRRFWIDFLDKTSDNPFPFTTYHRMSGYKGYHHDDPELYALCEKNGIVLDMRNWYEDGAEAYRAELCRELMRM